ncbi:MAG TPA: hypothetical protein VM925_31830 [Labilithrix sp.]|nr:hypothetical protein [Labilithrix sp.]
MTSATTANTADASTSAARTFSSSDAGTPGGTEAFSRVLRDVTTPVVLTLDDKTVFCTDRGYGWTVLKVSVPDLDWLGHFDHRVEGEGLPCITAGQCGAGVQPSSVLDAKNPRANVSVRVVLTEHVVLDRAQKTCWRSLTEHVTAEIRGQSFSHHRSGDIEPSDFDTCDALVKL